MKDQLKTLYKKAHPMTRATASLALATLAITFATSCTDVWNEHFDTANKLRASDKTLWEEICSHPELDGFRKILEQTGCDRELDGDQMFTVFAPQGAISTEGLTVDGMRDEIAYNHIARFATSANNELKEPRSIMLMNDKMGEFASESGTYTFSGQPLVKQNILAKNGVLHIIGGQIPFFCNVWEYMDKDTLYSNIRDYLYSFNEIELNEEASVAGAVVDGQITYVDSVTVNTNEMFYRLGQLNDEDSTYWMILPTNKAWEKAYRKVSSYYTYSTKNAARDSLQRHYTQMAMVSDLVFSHTMQRTPEDSIISTNKNVFYSPLSTLLPEYGSFADGIECSNGRVYPVDTLRYNPWESWHSEIQVEAENTRGREYTLCELYKRTLNASSPYYKKVADASYIETVPSTTSSNPSVTFSIPDVLSAKYDIKAVFLPQSLGVDKSNADKPNKLLCNLSTIDANGKSVTIKSDNIYTNPAVIDTVTLFSGYTFETCNYDEETVSTKLKILSQVTSKDRANYSRTLLIDCIIFEPAKE